MDLICSIKHNKDLYFFEADYFIFMLNVSTRENIPDNFRDGLININSEEKIDSYISYLEQFRLDLDELRTDYESLSDSEKLESDFCFFPTILIDFDERIFYSSHPELDYLGFERYLPNNWQYMKPQNVMVLIALHKRYWYNWNIPKG